MIGVDNHVKYVVKFKKNKSIDGECVLRVKSKDDCLIAYVNVI